MLLSYHIIASLHSYLINCIFFSTNKQKRKCTNPEASSNRNIKPSSSDIHKDTNSQPMRAPAIKRQGIFWTQKCCKPLCKQHILCRDRNKPVFTAASARHVNIPLTKWLLIKNLIQGLKANYLQVCCLQPVIEDSKVHEFGIIDLVLHMHRGALLSSPGVLSLPPRAAAQAGHVGGQG